MTKKIDSPLLPNFVQLYKLRFLKGLLGGSFNLLVNRLVKWSVFISLIPSPLLTYFFIHLYRASMKEQSNI